MCVPTQSAKSSGSAFCVQGDARSQAGNLSWETSADVEALAWDPHNPIRFLVSSEDGIVAAFDARGGGGAAPLFRLSAHDAPACCLSFNPKAKGLLATASTDKQVPRSRNHFLVSSSEGAKFQTRECLLDICIESGVAVYHSGGVWDVRLEDDHPWICCPLC